MSIEGREQLTRDDVRRIEEEIRYRKEEVRPKALEDLKTLNIMRQNLQIIRTTAASDIWRRCSVPQGS